jgi:hypothetical protein
MAEVELDLGVVVAIIIYRRRGVDYEIILTIV